MTKLLVCAGLSLGLTVAALAQKPKSQDEVVALRAMFAAQEPDAQIAAANNVIEKYADTEFKSIALFTIASAYQRKGDFPKTVTFGERAIEADPKNYQAMLLLASEYARTTKDTDFDKDDKLKKADKYVNDALALIKEATKPNPSMPDADWESARKDMTASAHEILGQIDMVKKKPEMAVSEYQTSIDTAANKDPATYVRLAQADNMLGKSDDAIAAAEKAMNSPAAVPVVKQFAQAERARAMAAKSKGGAPPSPGTSAAAPPAAPAPATTPAATATPAPPQP